MVLITGIVADGIFRVSYNATANFPYSAGDNVRISGCLNSPDSNGDFKIRAVKSETVEFHPLNGNLRPKQV